MSVIHSREQFSLSESRRIVKDLFEPRPWIYWTDFAISLIVGDILFLLVAILPDLMPGQAASMWALRCAAFLGCGLAYYRSALFIHELVHLPANSFARFRRVWNMTCGCFFLMPSFVYLPHVDHHRRKSFGTKADAEYVPLARLPRWHILLFLGQALVVPPLAVVRFFLLTPLSWFSPWLRNLIHQRASSLAMDPNYLRPLPTAETLRLIRQQELMCFLTCVLVTILLCTVLSPWAVTLLVEGYLLGVFILTLNAVRTLGAHRWTNDESEMSFVDQLMDSVNYPDRWFITELWGPLGLRYHALHHLFPSLPYHAMGEAHRRLMRELPADSPYRQTNRVSLLSVVWELITRRSGGAGESAHGLSESQAA